MPPPSCPALIVDARYAGSHNFVGRPIDGYEAPRCFLPSPPLKRWRKSPATSPRMVSCSRSFDCYRPARAVANFVRWAHNLNDTLGKREFYPEIDKRMLFRDGYISSRSGHSRGSTVDLTLARADGSELDMGTPFDFFSPRSWPSSIRASPVPQRKSGPARRRHAPPRFSAYAKEWWHFTLAHEPFPDTYFDFPVR